MYFCPIYSPFTLMSQKSTIGNKSHEVMNGILFLSFTSEILFIVVFRKLIIILFLLVRVQRHLFLFFLTLRFFLIGVWNYLPFLLRRLTLFWFWKHLLHRHLFLHWPCGKVLVRSLTHFLLYSLQKVRGFTLFFGWWLFNFLALLFNGFFFKNWSLIIWSFFRGFFNLFSEIALFSFLIIFPIVTFLLLLLFYNFLFGFLNFTFSQIFPHLFIFFLSIELLLFFDLFQLC